MFLNFSIFTVLLLFYVTTSDGQVRDWVRNLGTVFGVNFGDVRDTTTFENSYDFIVIGAGK